MVNDVKSIVVEGLWEELELRDAMLKFRDPEIGDSEGREEMGECVPFMMSGSVEKDELFRGGFKRHPFWICRDSKCCSGRGGMVVDQKNVWMWYVSGGTRI